MSSHSSADASGEGPATEKPTGEPPPPAAEPGADAQGGKAEARDSEPTQPLEDPAVIELRASAERQKGELEAAQARLRAVSKAYSELQTEMRGFKERMENRSKQDSELQALDQVRAFFDPVMNLKRSITMDRGPQPGEDVKQLVEGLKLVHAQFMESLRKLGLEEVAGEGAPFDPKVHEPLAAVPVGPEQDGKVIQVIASGYTVRGRVLQAAQVVIGKAQESAGEA
jgi:molecular chaperone GrpE